MLVNKSQYVSLHDEPCRHIITLYNSINMQGCGLHALKMLIPMLFDQMWLWLIGLTDYDMEHQMFTYCDCSIREHQARRIDIFMSLFCRYILEYSQGRRGSEAIGMIRKISVFTKDAKSDTIYMQFGWGGWWNGWLISLQLALFHNIYLFRNHFTF